MTEEIEDNINEAALVTSIVNLLKRIQNLEKRLIVVETALRLTKPHVNNARSKWEEWSRKIILKVIEFFIVVVSAIVGVKLASGL